MQTTPYTPAPDVTTNDGTHDEEPSISVLGRAVIRCSGILGVVFGIAWSVRVIVVLVRTPETTLARSCPDTSLWAFLLVATFVSVAPLTFISACLAKRVQQPRCTTAAASAWLLLMLGVYVWGVFCTFHDACSRDRLGDTSVFRLSRAWTLIVTVVMVLAVAILGSGVIKTCPACGCAATTHNNIV